MAMLPCFFSAAGESVRPRTVFVPRRSNPDLPPTTAVHLIGKTMVFFPNAPASAGSKFGNPHILPNDRREAVKIRFVLLASRILALRRFMMLLPIPSTSDCTLSFI